MPSSQGIGLRRKFLMRDRKDPELSATRLAAVFWWVCLWVPRQRNNVRFGWREIDELGHAGGMLVAEMAIDFHCQGATVLMAEPAGDGGNVNAALNAAGGEQMAQIVMGQMSDTGLSFRRFHRQLGLRYAHHASICRCIGTLLAQPFEEFAHFRDYGNAADFAVLGAFVRVAAHDDFFAR